MNRCPLHLLLIHLALVTHPLPPPFLSLQIFHKPIKRAPARVRFETTDTRAAGTLKEYIAQRMVPGSEHPLGEGAFAAVSAVCPSGCVVCGVAA